MRHARGIWSVAIWVLALAGCAGQGGGAEGGALSSPSPTQPQPEASVDDGHSHDPSQPGGHTHDEPGVQLADGSRGVPAGVGSTGKITLGADGMDAMLAGGASWAVGEGYGAPADLARMEEEGRDAYEHQLSTPVHQARRRLDRGRKPGPGDRRRGRPG